MHVFRKNVTDSSEKAALAIFLSAGPIFLGFLVAFIRGTGGSQFPLAVPNRSGLRTSQNLGAVLQLSHSIYKLTIDLISTRPHRLACGKVQVAFAAKGYT